MNLRTRFHFVAGLALVLSIVIAASVTAHPPLPGAPDLPLRVAGAAERTALVPLAVSYRQLDRHSPMALAQQAPGLSQLLPNWTVGRNAAMLLPNYEPGTVTLELLDIGAISALAPTPDARHAAPPYPDKP